MCHQGLRPVLVFAMILAACGIAHAGVESFEKTLRFEETLNAGEGFHVENLLGSITVEGGGPAGKVTVAARVVAEAETGEQAAALADTIRLASQDKDDWLRVRVSYPVDRHPAFRP
ncbi:MAG: hypothetical protein R3344_12605, partial [Acidobacteriota bacterium]|nr:hypothetical protein [Acidobacteriota bacterium]